ncbi:hypothetical protein EVC62_12455 [Salinicola endophyticus]|uniref:Secretin/TonB short N-terminal domain-containing protein n=1 Tax=Salinicola endophyticus TaxID=1949083 RepID=A0ABY8FJN0_9GAMM|nr:STN domain-containing protein [Salinicola endophyticus]WFF42250.1 hypothetical protein EVC62_12455 [Salinicola endophyticus]
MRRRLAVLAAGLVSATLLGGCAPAPTASSASAAPEASAAATPRGACDKPAANPIPSQRFDETVQQLAHATGCFIDTDLARTGAVRVHAVSEAMSIRQALEKALAGTSLDIVAQTSNRITVR